MKIGKALIGFLLLSGFYLGVLLWADSKNHVLSLIPSIVNAIPVLICFSLCSYLCRYLRWYWLLSRAGYQVEWRYGFLAYIAGFAFTATPGKVGELIRIRYFTKSGVPANVSFGAFVYERALDLVVVLILSSFIISRPELFVIAMSFVIIFLGLLALLAFNPKLLTYCSSRFSQRSWLRLSNLILTVRDGLTSCRFWLSPLDLLVSFTCGFAAWGITSYGFMWLLNDLGISIPLLDAFTIYPLAMLAGAASMLPSGVGSTELTIIVLLSLYGVATSIATLAAVGIRFATIWFAVLLGFICLGVLELKSESD
ncbi:flippase-like domain-containing protein [Polynucleobacter paneuropaeus]|nr:flippase-like domain-containing protein [Polynucleobacter paneuropaeus]